MKTIKLSKGTHVIVTGGAGFIGSHWVDNLIKNNIKITVIDNLSTGSLSNLNKKANFYKVGTENYNQILKIFKKVKPDIVFHFAANTNVPLSVKDPLYDFKTLKGNLNIIHLCSIFNVRKIIYLSSGFIYGNTKNRPTKETSPFNPLSPYGITKKCTEDYLQFYKKAYNLNYVILRPATIYGPRQRRGAMADFIQKLSKNTQAEIYGDGSKTRDYLFIDDLIEAITSVTSLENYKEPIFNIGTQKETSLKKMYFALAKILKKKSNPIYMPERPGELNFYCLDCSKINKATGWKPKTPLEKGLRKTVKWWNQISQ